MEEEQKAIGGVVGLLATMESGPGIVVMVTVNSHSYM